MNKQGGIMSKQCVLISIRPQWCELIANGKKTIEVRKTRPKLDTPFKCYIYCTQGSNHLCLMQNSDGANLIACCNWKTALPFGGSISNGKVIGEFVCDQIYQYSTGDIDGQTMSSEEMQKQSCLTYDELSEYETSAEPKENCIYLIGLYGWHISALQIYGKPKELSEFGLTRPFQSWGYVNGKAD